MPTRLLTHLRGNVVGYIALFLVLGGGSAYALAGHNTVFTDDIVNGQVRTVDLAKGLGGDGTHLTQKLTLPGSAPFTTIATTKLTLAQARDVPLHGATVEAVNGSASDIELTLRVLHDGNAESGEFTYTIAAGATQSVTAQGLGEPCLLPGVHTFELQAQSSATITLQDRSLAVAALPAA